MPIQREDVRARVGAPATLAEPATGGTLHEIFETRADARPDALAVSHGREQVSYADLEARANRIARHLRARGVGRGSLVAMLLRRSPDAYATILGILKAGAGYVPLDPGSPPQRIASVLDDCRARMLVTRADLAPPSLLGRPAVCLDAEGAAISARSPARLDRREVGAGPGNPCYVIYTSGSTGRPKGVLVEHRSVRHLVLAEQEIYEARPEDRVYQGASLAFDLSVEEIWIAFGAGATLVAATPEMEHGGPDLARRLAERGVTVLSTVPTLLSMLAQDVPSLRLLILGGEACPPHLVTRWARAGRRMVNTYGPTETTVIATYAVLEPGGPVTIGRPVPGYRVHLLDEDLRPVPPGEAGEICIGGPGVARGYVGRPEETRARFVPDPLAPPGEADARLYRSGDIGRLDAGGRIEFLGRRDGQVKLRGFRIELSEVETVLAEADGVLAAACAVQPQGAGGPTLAGYIVPRAGGTVDPVRLRSFLRERLPEYMVPALIETVRDLPRLPTGKLDRAALPAPTGGGAGPRPAGRPPRTGTERRIAKIWRRLFGRPIIAVDDDFFVDLGGHSLLAARMISDLRRDPRFARVSVLDLYEHPTIASLARVLDAAAPAARERGTPRLRAVAPQGRARGERARHAFAGALQALGLNAVFGLEALPWASPYIVYFLLLERGSTVLAAAAWGLAASTAVVPLVLIAGIASKWLLLGRIRPGRYPLSGGYYLRWWLAQTLLGAVPLDGLVGTPLLPVVYRLLGARIGRDVHLGTDALAAFDLIRIGDGTSVDDDASLLGYSVEGGHLVIAPVSVGHRCFIGTRSVLREGTVMEDGARLEDLSLLERGGRIPRGETWAGSPAERVAAPTRGPVPRPATGPVKRAAVATLYAGLGLVLPIVMLAAILPGVAFLTRLDPFERPLAFLAAAPLVGASFVVLLTAEVALLKWMLVGRVRPGTYPLHGGFYVRCWIVDRLLKISLDVIAPLYATLYLAPWYRLLGARLGRSVELSTATSMIPDLLEIGDGGTVADEASLGAPRVEGGWITMAPTRLGRRAFVGNSAAVPGGTELGDGSLVGVLSLAPARRSDSTRAGASWLGSPSFLLPRRQRSAGFSEARTYRPPLRLRLARGAFEILRVTLPPAGFILVAATLVTAALRLWHLLGPGPALTLLPLVYAGCGAAVLAWVLLAKWILIGRYRPFERPLWSLFIWRLELVNAFYEFLATPIILDALQGTPFLPWYLRLLGARIGRRVYVDTTGLLEWDLVEIGDRATLNNGCVMQTHLFEDRVLKASRLRIGADCMVGSLSVVLYDSVMEEGARLDALSLLMKGETLPASSSWAGIPAAWREDDRCRAMPAPPGAARAAPRRGNHRTDGDDADARWQASLA